MTENLTWPGLPYDEWRASYETLHMWTQIVGKIRLAKAPPLNHWWHTTLGITPRGLATSAIPHGKRSFEITFDFIDHVLVIEVSDGTGRRIQLAPRTTADFYSEVMARLDELGIPVTIWPRPVEVETPIRFDEDHVHQSYDAAQVERFHAALVQADRALQRFRGQFIGKSSPVHFFWGGFDIALTRFSGRRAPEHPGGAPNVGRHVMVEAYSHEVASFGWWPGSAAHPEPAFYAYAYPEPAGFSRVRVRPDAAQYLQALGEFVLPYEAVRLAPDPDAAVLTFCSDAYEAAADLGMWNRQALER